MNTKIRCLLLDDELPGIAYLKMMCEQLDELEVVKAFNSPQTLRDELPNLEFDLLITEIEMPGMNGLETIRAAILQRPQIQALLMTGYADEDSVASARSEVPVFRKPIRLEDLMAEIT